MRCLFYLAFTAACLLVWAPLRTLRPLACFLGLQVMVVSRGWLYAEAQRSDKLRRWQSVALGGPCSRPCSIPLASQGVCVGIAGPHPFERALGLRGGVVAGKIRALRIRFDSLSNPPPVGGTRVDPLCPSWRQPVVTSVPRRRSPERLITRRRARPARDCAPCPLPDPRPRNGTRDPSSHMRCIITASLRATATSARL